MYKRQQSQNKLSKVAIVMDVRGGELFNDLFDGLDDLKRQCGDYKILFLECDDQVLARRYKETRRQHPLASANDNSVLKAIAAERLPVSYTHLDVYKRQVDGRRKRIVEKADVQSVHV